MTTQQQSPLKTFNVTLSKPTFASWVPQLRDWDHHRAIINGIYCQRRWMRVGDRFRPESASFDDPSPYFGVSGVFDL